VWCREDMFITKMLFYQPCDLIAGGLVAPALLARANLL
jgi:hypothetical protein